MIEHCSIGDDRYDDRSELRAAVFEIAGGRCEHPVIMKELTLEAMSAPPTECGEHATELAHIEPRGMGHTGYRDTVNNAIAACPGHARSTDDLSSSAWDGVPPPHDRIALAQWIYKRRTAAGWAV